MRNELAEKRTILIIDSKPDMADLLERILTSEGYSVKSASDSTSGTSLLRETNPDLVLLDIAMPDRDGFMFLDAIRQHSDVPVIVVTTIRDTKSLKEALELGADDYIKKPFHPRELVARVNAKPRRA
ncbi:response regulator transcription factor [Chloroflexota bacterium]